MNKLTHAEFDLDTVEPVVSDVDRAIAASVTALAEIKEFKRVQRNARARERRAETRAYYSTQRGCCPDNRFGTSY